MRDFRFLCNGAACFKKEMPDVDQAFSGDRPERSSSSRDYLTLKGMPKVNCKTLFVTVIVINEATIDRDCNEYRP